jgi:hypothetical protein
MLANVFPQDGKTTKTTKQYKLVDETNFSLPAVEVKWQGCCRPPANDAEATILMPKK